MTPTPLEGCMGGKGTVMMERLLDAPAEMLGKGRAYVRHTLAPGVTIGSGAVIVAGSVVTHDIPAGMVAVGNPCRPLHPVP